ncbi:MAG: AAA family ATPase [Thermoleophilia bacterium]
MNRPFDRIPRWLRLTPLQWTVVIGAAVLAAIIGFVFQSQKAATYSATAQVLFRNAALDQALFSSPVFSSTGEPDRDAATNIKLIASNTVAQRVARVAGIPEDRSGELLASLSVGSAGNSNIADITFRDGDPERAAQIANVWAEQFVQTRVNADRAKVVEALDAATTRVDQLRSQGASPEEIARLQQQLDDLELLADVQTGGAEILDRAGVPSAPDQSSPKQVALGVGLLQGLLGLALMAGYRRLRDPVDGSEDLQELALPVLAELPRVQRVPIARGARSSEGFDSGLRLLLGNLKFVASPTAQFGTPTAQATVTAIQSTRPGEGKSTIAFHLARVAARSGSSVCLVDADLRFRMITRGIGEPHTPGLSSLLSQLSTSTPGGMNQLIDEALVSVEGFDLLTSGPPPPNPGDLSVRQVVPQIIENLRTRYDLIIIDAPPFLGLPDAARFLQSADSVVIVVRRRVARLYQVRRLIERLKVLGAHPVGTVLNMAAPRDEDLTYGYPDLGGEIVQRPRPATDDESRGRRILGPLSGRRKRGNADAQRRPGPRGRQPAAPAAPAGQGQAPEPSQPSRSIPAPVGAPVEPPASTASNGQAGTPDERRAGRGSKGEEPAAPLEG